jgi:ribonuclease E
VVEAPVEVAAEEAVAEKPKRTRKKKVDADGAEAAVEAAPAPEPAAPAAAEEAVAEKPKRTRKKKVDAEAAPEAAAEAPASDDASASDAEGSTDSPRRGWWQRTFGDGV